jgi:hypothetical protein
MQFLHHHRCDEIQGYLLSPPLDADKCLAFLRTWSPGMYCVEDEPSASIADLI